MKTATISKLGFGTAIWTVRVNDGIRVAMCFPSKQSAIDYCEKNGIKIIGRTN